MFCSFSPIHKFQQLFYVVKGIKRCQGKSRKKPLRAPVTPTMLLQIKSSLFTSLRSYEDKVMLWAFLLTAFFGFLRVSEYTASHKTKYDHTSTLCIDDVSLESSQFSLNIKSSKTDPFRQGVLIHIAKNETALCPYKALQRYLAHRLPRSGPLFLFHSNGKFLTRGDVNGFLKDATNGSISVSSHSLRIGAASTAAAIGCPKWLIQYMGRWTSDCFRNYIRIPSAMFNKTSKALAKCDAVQVQRFLPDCQFLNPR